MSDRRFGLAGWLLTSSLALAFVSSARADDVHELEKVPETLPAEERAALLDQRARLIRRSEDLTRTVGEFNRRCGSVSKDDAGQIARCEEEQRRLRSEQELLWTAAKEFRKAVRSAARLQEALRYFKPDEAAMRKAIGAVCADCARKGGEHCNWFVANVAEKLGVPFLRDLKPRDPAQHVADREGRRANDVWARMAEFAQNPASGWILVEGARAQALADTGFFVLGVQESRLPGTPGHVAVVARSDGTRDAKCSDSCRPPFIHDQRHNQDGSVGFNYAFKAVARSATDEDKRNFPFPRWYVYVPTGDSRP